MATRKENLKALFSNTRSRVIIGFTALVLVTTIVIGFVKFHSVTNPLNEKSGVQRGAAGIRSIPGSLNQTAQYAALQETQNVEQAKEAQEKGKSAIPTIIRSQAFGEGIESVGAQGGRGGVGFSTLARENLEGAQSSVWYQNLLDQHCSQDSLAKALDAGATLKEVKKVCTCEQLKRKGFALSELKGICPCPELRALGFSSKQFKEAGYCAAEMKVCGFTACEERGAGFSADEMKNAGYSDGELAGAGFTPAAIAQAGGLPDGVSLSDVQKAGCSKENLRRLRSAGVSAAIIRRVTGCSAEALKAAGYTALDLKNAGFSAAELKSAGFTAEELGKAGFSARALMNAGFSPSDLAAAGFSPADIFAAETVLPVGMSEEDVRKAGCSEEALKRQRLAGVSAYMIKKLAGCSASALNAAGFSTTDLARAGFKSGELTPQALAAAGKLDTSGVGDAEISKAGCDVENVKKLRDKGVTAQRIHDIAGCSADVLKKAGYGLADMMQAGFTRDQLLAAGFTPAEFATQAGTVSDNSGISNEQLRTAGCDPAQLKAMHDKGVSAKRIHDISGCSILALRNAGYGVSELAKAGFMPGQLLAAGFTPEELKSVGMALTPAGLIAAGRLTGCNPEMLRAARRLGASAAVIKQQLGCSAAAMKAAGYSALDLKEAGFTAAELKNSGFSASDMKTAGFSAKDLRAAGFSAGELKAVGYDASALKDAGFSATDLKTAGFSAADMKTAGFTAAELKSAGYVAADLKAAGFTAADMKTAGMSAAELKAAGYSNEEIQAAGFSARTSALAGLDDLAANKPASEQAFPSIPGAPGAATNKNAQLQADNAKNLEKILARQKVQMADQKYQQKVQQRTSTMNTAAGQLLQSWKVTIQQSYVAGTAATTEAKVGSPALAGGLPGATTNALEVGAEETNIKMGDIMFAVMDTSINSDEPGPILATIVSGALKGSKLIGSFNLPSNAEKMVISFNSMSIPGAPKTIGISAFAIDPNTARTALSSETDHHYLSRYGALFASTFLEGFGNAFQSADTTITVGGTGGTQQTTVQNGIGRSAMENAVIGLAAVGKAWGQVAQQNMSRPITVEIYSGTGVGILFTQDVKIVRTI
ncbi:MAG: type IVB secretion system protein DotG/IcmE [Legionellales bacterium]|nr:type IVB secretion system protein DotG/IcmE [Legionellales bacterium]